VAEDAQLSIAVVVPTNRPAMCMEFLGAWTDVLAGRADVIVMEDAPERTFDPPHGVRHFSHGEAAAELGEDAWIIPQRSSACRSYGTLKAVELGADVVWHLDDDTRPEPGVPYLWRLERILGRTAPDPSWWNTLGHVRSRLGELYPRGYPYDIRASRWPVMVHHGLWSNVPDFDGLTQLAMPDYRLWPAMQEAIVPRGAFFPMCGMNLAFRREAAPLFYMGLQGGDWPYDRFDDMWAGLFAKKIADHLGWAVSSGAPSVRHDRASDAARNAEIEAPGIAAHEQLWPWVAAQRLSYHTAIDCYEELAAYLGADWGRMNHYWRSLSVAMGLWTQHARKALG